MRITRLRMFAGPNGSGKSTIKAKVAEIDPNVLGVYINRDDIEREIAASGQIDFTHFKIKTTEESILASRKNSFPASEPAYSKAATMCLRTR